MTVEVDPNKVLARKPAEQSKEQSWAVPEMKKVTLEELNDILKKHEKWLESGRKDGELAILNDTNLQEANLCNAKLQEAHLQGANLQKTHLQGAQLHRAMLGKSNLLGANLHKAGLKNTDLKLANLQQSILVEADLQGANLHQANLQGAYLLGAKAIGAVFIEANLQQANLQEADLTNANFHEANLLAAKFQDADLSYAKGLKVSQFKGCNVSGAKLPDYIAKFEGLGQVKEISQRAQKLFLSLLLGCVYCWLTIGITTDVELITNSGSSPLPIIQTKIPIVGFYWAAPLILLSLYFWFHLYLQRLWEDLSELPAVFPDGKTLDKKVFPWLINGMVRSHVRLLKEHRPALSRIQTGISILLAWWLVPFTFLFFWLRYIPRHDWVGTSLHIGVLAVSITAAILLYRLAAKTLRGEETFSVSWKEKWESLPAYQPTSLTLGILGLCFLIFFNLSTWSIEGFPRFAHIHSWADLSEPPGTSTPYEWHDGPILLPRLFEYFGYRTYAYLVEADISTKPPTWTGQKDNLKNEIPFVKGAKLKDVNLQNAVMSRAFLINADLRQANLQNAQLDEANLQNAKLTWADLQNAQLGQANLQNAELLYANMQNAQLKQANLTDVRNFTQAQLNEACVDKRTILPEGLTRPKPCPVEELSKK